MECWVIILRFNIKYEKLKCKNINGTVLLLKNGMLYKYNLYNYHQKCKSNKLTY